MVSEVPCSVIKTESAKTSQHHCRLWEQHKAVLPLRSMKEASKATQARVVIQYLIVKQPKMARARFRAKTEDSLLQSLMSGLCPDQHADSRRQLACGYVLCPRMIL